MKQFLMVVFVLISVTSFSQRRDWRWIQHCGYSTQAGAEAAMRHVLINPDEQVEVSGVSSGPDNGNSWCFTLGIVCTGLTKEAASKQKDSPIITDPIKKQE